MFKAKKLLIDIGNTSCHIYLNDEILINKRISINKENYTNTINKINNFIDQLNTPDMIICSVVPKISDALLNKYQKAILFTNKDAKYIKLSHIKNFDKIGSDRVAGMNGVIKSFNLKNFVLIDFGTATKIEIIKDFSYFKGMILPNYKLSLEYLFNSAELIPNLDLDQEKCFGGMSNQTQIVGSYKYAYILMIDAIIEKIQKDYKINNIFITGGNYHFFKNEFNFKYIYDELLIFKGIYE